MIKKWFTKEKVKITKEEIKIYKGQAIQNYKRRNLNVQKKKTGGWCTAQVFVLKGLKYGI